LLFELSEGLGVCCKNWKTGGEFGGESFKKEFKDFDKKVNEGA
jgi:hypothetical protein